MKESYDCIIIGSGIAGHSAAAAFRNKNPEASLAMITQDEAPLYSPCILPDYLAGRVDKDQVFMKHQANYQRLGFDWIGPSAVTGIELDKRSLLLETGQTGRLRYGRLILATGSLPALPPFLGGERKGLYTFKWLTDAEKIKGLPDREAVVLGSGMVGLEVAAALAAKGVQVTLIEALPRILPQLLDQGPADLVKEYLEAKGIKVLTGTRVEAVLGKDEVQGVATAGREIPARLVVAALGMIPNTALAKTAGIELGSARGITVDAKMRTSAPEVFACGDCVESPDFLWAEPSLSLFWYAAKVQGRLAGANAAGAERCFTPYPRMAVTSVFGVPVYSLGHTRAELEQRGKKPEVVKEQDGKGLVQMVLLEGRLVGIQMINRMRGLPYLFPSLHLGRTLDEMEKLRGAKIASLPHLYRFDRFGPLSRILQAKSSPTRPELIRSNLH